MINKLGYGIELSKFTKDELVELKQNLTVKPNVLADYDFGQVEPFKVFKVSSTRIYVPRFYGIEHYGPADKNFKESKDIHLTFNSNLKPHQTKFCDTLLKEIKINGSCIGMASTGSGKTVCALWLITQLKKKTLILVHKQFLMDQWVERIKQFIPDAKIGIIKQDKCEMDNDIIIGMIQTITSREYPKGTFDDIGFLVADETHHLAASKFSQVLFKCGSEYSLGLSATPNRKDGLTKVLEWFLGSIISNEISSEVQKPTVEFLKAEYSTEIKPKFNFKQKLNAPDMINQLVKDPRRNELIAHKSIQLHSEGRKQLILTGRRDHCFVLEKLIKNIKKDVHTGIYIGGMKEAQLNESNKADIILATYQSVSEGYDNPSRDTLIMATGLGDVTQSVGRILRRKNENYPLVIDVTDKEHFAGQAKRRHTFYKNQKYTINGEKKTLKLYESSLGESVTEEYMFV